MKNLIRISLTAFALSFTIAAQSTSDKLVMTGTITDIDVVVTSVDRKRTTSFVIQIAFQVKNISQEPYLVLRPNRFFGTRRVEFRSPSGSVGDSSTRETEPVCGLSRSNPCNYYIDTHLDFLRRLEFSQTPDTLNFATIEPGGYFEFIDTFTVESGYEFDEAAAVKELERQEKEYWDANRSQINSAKTDSLRDHYRKLGESEFKQKIFKYVGSVERTKYPSISVDYQYSAKRNTKARDIFLTVQNRWQNYGKLPLSGDTYLLRSAEIINDPSFVP